MNREDLHASNTAQIFNKTIEEKFPKLRKDIPFEMQGANSTPSRQGNNKFSMEYYSQSTKYKEQKEGIQSLKRKLTVYK